MSVLFYWLALMGFLDAGWPFWRCIWWPYYLARRLGRATPGD